MRLSPRYVVRRANGREVAELYDLTVQRQVCLHTEDPDLVRRLEEQGALAPRRPPFLDASHHGVHGAYAVRPQINWFFAPPIEDVATALAGPLRQAGYDLARADTSSPVAGS